MICLVVHEVLKEEFSDCNAAGLFDGEELELIEGPSCLETQMVDFSSDFWGDCRQISSWVSRHVKEKYHPNRIQ